MIDALIQGRIDKAAIAREAKSGNPKGQPNGFGLPAKLRHAIAADAPDMVQALIAQAKAGDVQAARVLLDRAVPRLKHCPGFADALHQGGKS